MFGIPTQRLAKVTVTETTSAVTLSVNPIVIAALSFTPRHLLVRTQTQATSGNPNLFVRFNGDSGSNYNSQVFYGYATSAGAWAGTNTTALNLIGNIDDLSNAFSVSETLFPDALSTRTHKSALCLSGRLEEVVEAGGGRWENTAAITSVTCFLDSSTFAAGSTFELCVVDEAYVIDEEINTGTADFDKSSISAADGDLVIIGNLRSDVASNIEEVSIRFNGDTGGNYTRQRLRGNNSTSLNAAQGTTPVIAHGAGANATADSFSGLLVHIPNFSDGSIGDRNAATLGGGHFSDSDQIIGLYNTRWNNTDAINRVEIYGLNQTSGFLANSMLSIYKVPKNLIERQELSGNATTVTFADIPQTYDHLELSIQGRAVGTAVGTRAIAIEVNADSTDGNYAHQVVYGQSTTVAASQYANENLTIIPAQTATANIFGVFVSTFYNYTKTDRHKHYLTVGGIDTSIELISSRWENTAAISSFVVKCNADDYLAGSVFTLRGIHSTAPAAASDVAALNSIAPADIAAVN